MSEVLHAPDMDLAGLDACAGRIAMCASLLSRMEHFSSNVDGVAGLRVKEALPNLPLLSTHSMKMLRIGGMSAGADYHLHATRDKEWAALSVTVWCLPALARTTVTELVRSDMSNAISPADGPEKAVAMLRRTEALVRAAAARLKSAISAQQGERGSLQPHASANASIASTLMAILKEEAGDALEDFEEARATFRTGAPFGPISAQLILNPDHSDAAIVSFTAEALTAYGTAFPPQVSLTARYEGMRVSYLFGRVELELEDDTPIDASDPMTRLRLHAQVGAFEGPIWAGDRVLDGNSPAGS